MGAARSKKEEVEARGAPRDGRHERSGGRKIPRESGTTVRATPVVEKRGHFGTMRMAAVVAGVGRLR